MLSTKKKNWVIHIVRYKLPMFLSDCNRQYYDCQDQNLFLFISVSKKCCYKLLEIKKLRCLVVRNNSRLLNFFQNVFF